MTGYRFVVYLFWSDGKLGKMGVRDYMFYNFKVEGDYRCFSPNPP